MPGQPPALLASLGSLFHSRLTITHWAASARKGPGGVRTQAGTLPLAALNLALLARVGKGEIPVAGFSQETEMALEA